jgi:hypothetical protein
VHTILTGNDDVSREEAEATSRHYTPGLQEDVEETPDEADRTPVTEAERKSLDEATADVFQPIAGDQQNDRAPTFEVPGDWVSPVVRHRRKQAMLFASVRALDDLDGRVARLCRFGAAPKPVQTAQRAAREALAAARQARIDGAHPDNPKFARDTVAKDHAAVTAAEAVRAVSHFERIAEEHAEAWFVSLTSDLDRQRAEALTALKEASKAYSGLRATINGANVLAIEQGRWDKSWHCSTVSELDLNRPVGSLREAIGFLENGDDFTDGSFLVADYGQSVPPHTLGKLKRGAEVAGGGTFAAQVYARAVAPMANDRDAQEAIAEKRLILLLNSNPATAELVGERHQD